MESSTSLYKVGVTLKGVLLPARADFSVWPGRRHFRGMPTKESVWMEWVSGEIWGRDTQYLQDRWRVLALALASVWLSTVEKKKEME